MSCMLEKGTGLVPCSEIPRLSCLLKPYRFEDLGLKLFYVSIRASVFQPVPLS